MCSFNRAQLSKFIAYLLLYNLNSIIDPCNHGLYQDEGFIIVDDCMPRRGDIIKKKLCWVFNKFGFKLNIQTNLKITDYLDGALSLHNVTVSPFKKKKTTTHVTLM